MSLSLAVNVFLVVAVVLMVGAGIVFYVQGWVRYYQHKDEHFDYLRDQYFRAQRLGLLHPDYAATAHADGSVSGIGPDGERVTIPATDLLDRSCPWCGKPIEPEQDTAKVNSVSWHAGCAEDHEQSEAESRPEGGQ